MTKPKKPKTKPINVELSIREFKVWLDGLCSFNADDWTPNLDQWTLIKNKLMNLKENNQPTYPQNTTYNGMHNIQPQPILPPPVTFEELSPEVLARKIEQAKSGGTAIKTPHIDTSNGFKSSYD